MDGAIPGLTWPGHPEAEDVPVSNSGSQSVRSCRFLSGIKLKSSTEDGLMQWTCRIEGCKINQEMNVASINNSLLYL